MRIHTGACPSPKPGYLHGRRRGWATLCPRKRHSRSGCARLSPSQQFPSLPCLLSVGGGTAPAWAAADSAATGSARSAGLGSAGGAARRPTDGTEREGRPSSRRRSLSRRETERRARAGLRRGRKQQVTGAAWVTVIGCRLLPFPQILVAKLQDSRRGA